MIRNLAGVGRKLRRPRALVVAAAIGLSTLAPVLTAATPAQAAAGDQICPTYGGGKYICKYGVTGPVYFPTGQQEWFVVGTDNAVWTYWNDLNGNWYWASLGGYVTSSVQALLEGSWGITILALGSDGNAWCKDRANSQGGGWDSWHRCV